MQGVPKSLGEVGGGGGGGRGGGGDGGGGSAASRTVPRSQLSGKSTQKVRTGTTCSKHHMRRRRIHASCLGSRPKGCVLCDFYFRNDNSITGVEQGYALALALVIAHARTHSCAHSHALALACTHVQGKTGLPPPEDVAARLLIEGKV